MDIYTAERRVEKIEGEGKGRSERKKQDKWKDGMNGEARTEREVEKLERMKRIRRGDEDERRQGRRKERKLKKKEKI